jgi:hypothetical protein
MGKYIIWYNKDEKFIRIKGCELLPATTKKGCELQASLVHQTIAMLSCAVYSFFFRKPLHTFQEVYLDMH